LHLLLTNPHHYYYLLLPRRGELVEELRALEDLDFELCVDGERRQ
tara:strand:- start:326 stop:460 length:135 start_codon:yes stop_codon:yes gene_type:complete